MSIASNIPEVGYFITKGELHKYTFTYDSSPLPPREGGDCITRILSDETFLSKATNCSDVISTDVVKSMGRILNMTFAPENFRDSRRTKILEDFFKKECLLLFAIRPTDNGGIYGYPVNPSLQEVATDITTFLYVPKRSPVINEKKALLEESEFATWVSDTAMSEIHRLNAFLQGRVYVFTEYAYSLETKGWETVKDIPDVYLYNPSMAFKFARENISGLDTFLPTILAERHIEDKTVDVLFGQRLFNFESIDPFGDYLPF